jgi:hypothetical protein
MWLLFVSVDNSVLTITAEEVELVVKTYNLQNTISRDLCLGEQLSRMRDQVPYVSAFNR